VALGDTVDGLATRAVAASEVAALAHEVRDDAVEHGALVAQRDVGSLGLPLLAGAERAEVLARLGGLRRGDMR
jgi:hypothetical protein